MNVNELQMGPDTKKLFVLIEGRRPVRLWPPPGTEIDNSGELVVSSTPGPDAAPSAVGDQDPATRAPEPSKKEEG
jgi:hypothetical protein